MDTSFCLPDLICSSQAPTDTQEAGFPIRTHLQACVEEMRQFFGGATVAQAASGPVAILQSVGVDAVAAWCACALAGRPLLMPEPGNPPPQSDRAAQSGHPTA